MDKPIPLTEFQEQQCRGCRYADAEKVGTGEPCCTYAFGLLVAEGVCLTRKELAKGKGGRDA